MLYPASTQNSCQTHVNPSSVCEFGAVGAVGEFGAVGEACYPSTGVLWAI